MNLPTLHLQPIEDARLWDLMARAEEIGLRLEMGDAGIIWEALPGLRHQEITTAVFMSVTPGKAKRDCDCYRVIDVAIPFPDGTTKRPDLAIFCQRPQHEEGFIYEVPEAVVEITSPGYEEKDLVLGPPLYMRNGVRDVVVLDRRTDQVHHWGRHGQSVGPSPRLVELACGSELTL